MMHFMGELQAFCQLEAIELAWQDLIKFAQAREGDLDSLIGEHRLYLKKVAGRIFLLNPKAGEEVSLFPANHMPLPLTIFTCTGVSPASRQGFSRAHLDV